MLDRKKGQGEGAPRLCGAGLPCLGGDTKFDGASINFLESVSMVPLSTFGETFVKFAQISLKKKGRGVSEGPRREKNSEKSQNTTPF
jgi:hypothetical protein